MTIRGISITKKEAQIISCLLNGRRTKSIAALFNISPYTVTSHIRNIMTKLNISSQDQLIRCVETSESYIKLKNLYFDFKLQDIFLSILQSVKNIISNRSLNCLIFISEENENIKQLIKYFKFVGINTDIQIKQDSDIRNNNLITDFKKIYFGKNKYLDDFKDNIGEVILCEKREDSSRKTIYSICNETTDNYYYAILKLIDKICGMENVKEIINKFKYYISNSEAVFKSENASNECFEYYRKNIMHFITGAVVITLTFIYNFIFNNQNVSISNIQNLDSNSIIYREDMIKQMDTIANKQKGLHYIVLTGEAGIGKTTLSKIYGARKHSKLCWLINAETEDSIKNSFIDIANSLAAFGSSSLKESLLYIKSIKDKQEMFNQIILFVFKNLESIKNWYIIFDNVNDFNMVNNYLPRNPNNNGTIVITTRDFNICSYLDIPEENHLTVNYLTEKERFDLFKKVCKKEDFGFSEILKSVLEKIPSTPLDICILANYLNNIEFNNDKLIRIDSIDLQKIYKNEFYKPINYPYTRYMLMKTILEKIIKSNPEFKDLLLMLGILNSQDIPKRFFINLKNDTITDEFIFNLRKFSIITMKNDQISLHRNLQKIIRDYMFNLMPNGDFEISIEKIIDSLTDYNFIRLIASHSEISELLPHVNSIMDIIKNSNLTNKEKYIFKLNVSKFFIYNDIYTNHEIINFAETSLLPNLHKGYINDYEKVILLNDITYNYLAINELDKAKNIIRKCQEIYEKSESAKFSGLEAITLSYLANLENNKESEKYFEKALIKLKNSDDLWKDTATAIVYYQYYSFCLNNFAGKEIFEKTANILENFLKSINCNEFFYKKYKRYQYKGELPFFVPGIRYRLAGIYNILELYTKALECIYEVKYFCKDRRDKGNLSLGLDSDLDIEYGQTLLRLNKTTEAYNILKRALDVKMKIRDKHDLFRGFVYLSECCLRLKKYDEFYKICKECSHKDSSKYDKLLHLHYLYNIFVAGYKTNSNKTIDNFRNFFDYSKRIYPLFLSKDNIKELNDFSIEFNTISSCIEYSKKVFAAIYGYDHSFVKNYLVKN